MSERTNRLRQTNHLMLKWDEQIFQRTNCLIFGRLERPFARRDQQVDSSMT